MDSILQPDLIDQILGPEILQGHSSDSTSLVFYHGEYKFDLTIHKRLMSPRADELSTIPPLMLPGPALNETPTTGFSGDGFFGDSQFSDWSGGSNDIFSNRLKEDEPMSAHDGATEPVSERRLQSNFGINNPFFTPNEREVCSEQQFGFHGLFPCDFKTRIPSASFQIQDPNPNMILEVGQQEDSDLSFCGDSTCSSADLNRLGDPIPPSGSADISSCSEQFNLLKETRVSNQETSFSSALSTASSNISSTPTTCTTTTTPMISASSPDAHICSYCHLKFTRSSDLKRHKGRHFPEQWGFHCKQSGCERKGQKGFYRRDKLIAHERQVHGMGN